MKNVAGTQRIGRRDRRRENPTGLRRSVGVALPPRNGVLPTGSSEVGTGKDLGWVEGIGRVTGQRRKRQGHREIS